MKADPKAAAPATPKSSKTLMMIIAAVVVLGLCGGAAWFFTQGLKPDSAKPHKEAKAAVPVFVPVEPFTVNLQPENGDQYLQVTFTLQVLGLEQVELIKTNMPKVRSRVLLLLSGKRASEIATVEGKQQLAKEIIAAIKLPFADKGEPQQVSDVLFTSFIIQ
jgi:flagellar protein FliL